MKFEWEPESAAGEHCELVFNWSAPRLQIHNLGRISRGTATHWPRYSQGSLDSARGKQKLELRCGYSGYNLTSIELAMFYLGIW